MRSKMLSLGLTALLGAGAAGASTAAEPARKGEDLKIAPDIEKRVAQFSPTPYEVDLSALSAKDRQVLDKLVEASKLVQEIWLRQVWAGNAELREQVKDWQGGTKGAAREYFTIMAGPFDRQAEREVFIGGFKHPAGAGFYPEDLTKEEFEKWLAAHPGDRASFSSNFTVIQRKGKDLVAVPYSQEYRQWLEPAARLLREAAALTDNASLKKFLELRADAFEIYY